MNQNELLGHRAKMMEAIRARQAAAAATQVKEAVTTQKQMANIPLAAVAPALTPIGNSSSANEITFNEQQELAITYAMEGRDFCLIGAAGTGKTTTVREMMRRLVDKFNALAPNGHMHHDTIKIVSFTRRAVRNIAKAVRSVGADKYCETIHSALKYQPNKDGYYDDEGNWCNTFRFEPTITKLRPNLEVKLIVLEEASMCGYSTLYRELREGFPNATFIFIGDLNQLPPVFGDAVLGFKLAELPVVELTQVYRQAMESPIIWFQHNHTLKGAIATETLLKSITDKATDDKGLVFTPFKQNHNDGEIMSQGVADYMIRQLEAGNYDPVQDTILIPFNKSFGSIAINLEIAEYLAKRNKLEVHEIIASYDKKYFAVSDFVMHEKRECIIHSIEPNPKYIGIQPQPASVDLNRYGYIRMGGHSPVIDLDAKIDFDLAQVERILDSTDGDGDGDKTIAASHIITLVDTDTQQKTILSTTGEVRSLDFGYCMTIHKSQGSEWRKVWLVLHRMHATMLSRELLYTGMTRAREKLTVLYSAPTATGRKDSSISKCLLKAVIPGIGWQNKVQYFKGKENAASNGWVDRKQNIKPEPTPQTWNYGDDYES